ncbi:hypothetical protein DFH08DRAFT_798292 [Mycena albidolilacea]|uniref:Uncharacterized protein n=1 Tax=Mycena albidolilacea TaxID=1033008 RepID=A0AAD7ANA1_9AGAR|nr:hypothetical protein DFH08DRAFT_798292 [Mycena albidolilacea]
MPQASSKTPQNFGHLHGESSALSHLALWRFDSVLTKAVPTLCADLSGTFKTLGTRLKPSARASRSALSVGLRSCHISHAGALPSGVPSSYGSSSSEAHTRDTDESRSQWETAQDTCANALRLKTLQALKTGAKTSRFKSFKTPQGLKLRAKISRLKTPQEHIKISRLKMRVKSSRF